MDHRQHTDRQQRMVMHRSSLTEVAYSMATCEGCINV
jgi:hypothetical protein